MPDITWDSFGTGLGGLFGGNPGFTQQQQASLGAMLQGQQFAQQQPTRLGWRKYDPYGADKGGTCTLSFFDALRNEIDEWLKL